MNLSYGLYSIKIIEQDGVKYVVCNLFGVNYLLSNSLNRDYPLVFSCENSIACITRYLLEN